MAGINVNSMEFQMSLPPCGNKATFIKSKWEPKYQRVIVDIDLKDISIQRCPSHSRALYSDPSAVVVVYSHKVLEDEQKEKIKEIYISPNKEDFFFIKEKEDLCYLCNYVKPCMFVEKFSNPEEMYNFMIKSNFFNVSIK